MFFHQSQTWWSYHSITWGRLQKRSDSLPHIHCLLVDMKYQGMIDLKDKPFGRCLLIEVQWRTVFFTEWFVTNDKRRDRMREINCYRNVPWQDGRKYSAMTMESSGYCHHCHGLLDHWLSVSDTNVLLFYQMVQWIYSHFVYVYTDWHDGRNVPWARQPRQSDEWRHCLFDRTVQIQIDRITSGHATGYD